MRRTARTFKCRSTRSTEGRTSGNSRAPSAWGRRSASSRRLRLVSREPEIPAPFFLAGSRQKSSLRFDVGLGIAATLGLLSEDHCAREVRTCRHKEKQRYRQEKVCTGSQEGLAGEGSGILAGSAGQHAADDLFVAGPDDAPDVEQHDDTHAPADANREYVVIIAAHRSVVHEDPSGGVDQGGGDRAQDVSAGRDVLDHEKQDGPDREPEPEEEGEHAALADALALRVGCD